MEENLEARVLDSQQNPAAADKLIEDYLPFIRRETARSLGRVPQKDEDALSVAMLAFYEAMGRYTPGRGKFLSLASLTIGHRLADLYRKERRHEGQISLNASWEGDSLTLEEQLPEEEDALRKRVSQREARQEIEEFSRQLGTFGLTLSQVADSCPKQERNLEACMQALDFARQHPEILEELVKSKKLPLLRLCLGAGVERKTLERHRAYIIALLLAYTNGYEIIRGHIRYVKRKEGR